MTRPSLEKTIEAMRQLTTDSRIRKELRDDPELHDLLATAEYVNFDHQSINDEYSSKTGWGRCETCNTKWPCASWVTVESAIVEYLIKNSSCLGKK